MSDLYDADLIEWSEHQAELLRQRAAGRLINEQDLDWTNLAEEIEDLGKSQRAALGSHVLRILEHLMKLDASPALDPRRGWEDTVQAAQSEVAILIEASPSLRRTVGEVIARQLPRARANVARTMARYDETPRLPLEALAYSAEAVLGEPPEA